MPRRALLTILASAAALTLVSVFRLLIGGDTLGWPSDPAIAGFRLVHVASGVIVGGGLALAGVLLQSMLRNPLASPDLMGLSAGAGLAVTISSYVTFLATGAVGVVNNAEIAALVGSFAALAVVYTLSQRSWLIDPVAMVLVGVVVSFVLGALTVFVQNLMPDRGESARRWLMGRLDDDTPTTTLAISGGVLLVSTMMSVATGRWMDASAMSEDEARSAGVPLGGLRAMQFVVSGVLTGMAVAIAGPLGFVGLICPHLARLAAGPSHRTLVIASPLLGAALVVAADCAVKAARLGGGHLPIGVLTSLIGGPLFIWLLLRERASMIR
ncbi:MAG: hypothetical protein CMJ31_12450 [Phycisphaerae bacterium]|nr:hypothetical protein [Phycisphaerae bacterium]